MKIGYARVSRDAQELGRQIDALTKYGCDQIREEKQSGAIHGSKRPVLGELLQLLTEGDTLVIAKLDRLGRSLVDLIKIVNELNARKIGLVSLGDNIDTMSATGRLTLHVFGAFAEFERDIIRERTTEGLRHARSKGIILGRPQLAADKVAEIKKLKGEGKSVSKIAREMSIHRSTVYKTINAN